MMQIPIFFIGTITLTSLTLFNLGINGMYVNRTFLNIPISLIESNVIEEEVEDDEQISINYYFNQDNLKNDIKNYLTYNLKNKILNYKIGFNFFNYDNGIVTEEVENSLCNGIQIHFITNYYLNYKINNYLLFHIEKGIVYNE